MLKSIFLLNKEGTIIIEQHYRDRVQRSDIDFVIQQLQDNQTEPPSIQQSGAYVFLLLSVNDLWLLGVCEGDDFAPFAVSILEHISELLGNLLKGGCTEISVKNEYPKCYQILDLAIDDGFPFLDEGNCIDAVLDRQPTDPKNKGSRLQIDINRPWRKPGIKYTNNFLNIDVIECVDVIVNPNGRTEFCNLRGSLKVNCHISGGPRCTLYLTPQTHFEDAVYHRCVDLDMPNQKTFTFTPPDGMFTLMDYRLTSTQTTLPLWVVPKFNWAKGGVTFDITIRMEQSLPNALDDVELKFVLPEGVGAPSLSVIDGRTMFDPTTRTVTWEISHFLKKESTTLRGSSSTELSFELADRHPVIVAKFSTIGSTTSGFHIEKLLVEGSSRNLQKGAKYITQAGSYAFRTGGNV